MSGLRPRRPLRGVRLKAPCWWCSRALRGGHGVLGLVDRKPTAFHAACLREARRDSDLAGRVAVIRPWTPLDDEDGEVELTCSVSSDEFDALVASSASTEEDAE